MDGDVTLYTEQDMTRAAIIGAVGALVLYVLARVLFAEVAPPKPASKPAARSAPSTPAASTDPPAAEPPAAPPEEPVAHGEGGA